MIHRYDLTLGLPHTNRRGLWEPLLLMSAGHFQWQSIATAIGLPLSALRTISGGEVYAAFYYIEERIPDRSPLESFGLDTPLTFAVALRSFKNIAVEGRLFFDRSGVLGEANPTHAPLITGRDDEHPFVRFGNIFITPVQGNSELRVAPPANADFSQIVPLPNEHNPYQFTREWKESGRLGLLNGSYRAIGEASDYVYKIDVDRDTNGAGLVYFANYITFLEAAERTWFVARNGAQERSLRRRRTAFYGNADPWDTIRVRLSFFEDPQRPGRIGVRYAIERQQDGRLICLSEAIKVLS